MPPMAEKDCHRWDAAWRGAEGRPPSSFLVGPDAALPDAGRALDVAGGLGPRRPVAGGARPRRDAGRRVARRAGARFLREPGEPVTLLPVHLRIVSLTEDWTPEGRHEARRSAMRWP